MPEPNTAPSPSGLSRPRPTLGATSPACHELRAGALAVAVAEADRFAWALALAVASRARARSSAFRQASQQ